MRKGFTLLELLVVISIIGILISVSAVTYSSIGKNARDSRRKTDLEEIRSAIELYRSDNGTYPAPTFGAPLCGPLGCENQKYLEKVPQDPLSTDQIYYYSGAGTVDYTLGAALESTTSTCSSAPADGCTKACNYCLGPYGQK